MKPEYILLVDDELPKIEEYLIYLEERLERYGLSIVVMDNVDTALVWLRKHNPSLVLCLIIDVMMPWGRNYSGPITDYGLLTGLILYKDARRIVGADVNIFLLTNNSDPRIVEVVREDPRARVILKTDVLYDEFGDLVESVISSQSI